MECETTVTRRRKTFDILHGLPVLGYMPTALINLVSEYAVVPYLAGHRDGTIWIRQADDEQQPWRPGFTNLILPRDPVAMAVTNQHLLVAMQDSDFDAMYDIVALPWDAPNRTEWKTRDYLNVRLSVLDCGTPVVLHWELLHWDDRRAFLHIGCGVKHPVPQPFIQDLTTSIVWNDRLLLCGGGPLEANDKVRMWDNGEWRDLSSLCEATSSATPIATPLGLLLLGGVTRLGSALIQCLPSLSASSWIVLHCRLPAAVPRSNAWCVNGRLYFATYDRRVSANYC